MTNTHRTPRRTSALKGWPAAVLLAAAQVAHAQASPQAPPDSGAQSAYTAADAAYRALDQGNTAQAIEMAQRATRLAPGNKDYARLLMQSYAAAGRTREAVIAADQALAMAPDDVQTLAERGRLRLKLGDRNGSRADLEAALASPAISPTDKVSVLADLGRMEQARRAYRALAGTGTPAGGDATRDMEMGYLAARVGEPALALAAFRRADEAGKLPGTALRDVAYAADQAGQPEVAARYFSRAVDAAQGGRASLSPQEMFETRRSYAELTRRWGVFASLGYRSGGGTTPGFGALSSTPLGSNTEAGVEAWWRPMGSRNGKYWELFARGFQTLHSELGESGARTRLAGAGARIKPLTDQNLVLSLSRVDSRSSGADWLAQAGYSYDHGSDIVRDRKSWPTWRTYAELGRYMNRGQNYAVGGAQVGRSFRVNDRDEAVVVFPHVGLVAEYDSQAITRHSIAAGPGLGVRHWFRGDVHAAPRSYLDLTLQYRVHLDGDPRTKGWFATALLSY